MPSPCGVGFSIGILRWQEPSSHSSSLRIYMAHACCRLPSKSFLCTQWNLPIGKKSASLYCVFKTSFCWCSLKVSLKFSVDAYMYIYTNLCILNTKGKEWTCWYFCRRSFRFKLAKQVKPLHPLFSSRLRRWLFDPVKYSIVSASYLWPEKLCVRGRGSFKAYIRN